MADKEKFSVRKPWMAVFGLTVPILGVILIAAFLSPSSNAIRHLGDAAFGSVVFTAFAVFFWSIAWRSCIRVRPDRLTVRNIFYIHTIPWSQVEAIELDDGLQITLTDGEVVGSIQFGGALIGALTGYPTYRKPVQRLQRAHHRHTQHPAPNHEPQRSTRFHFPYLDAAAFYAFFAVPMFAKAITIT